MENEFAKFKKLNLEYKRLLGLLGETSNEHEIKLERLGKHIKFLEKEIPKLKEQIESNGIIDVND